MSGDYSCLTLTVQEAVAHVRLIRPELHNRFDEFLHAEFPRALAQVAAMQEPAALVISSEGRSFSAGGDLNEIIMANKSSSRRDKLTREALGIIEGLLAMPIPVIAAVQGAAVGLGASVVSCCDMVVAWKEAKLADTHVHLGLVAGDGGVVGWSHSLGVMRAKRYLLTGDAITGAEAHAMGMVSDLVDSPEQALPAALELAQRIAAMPRGGVRGTKRAFARLTRGVYGDAFELSLAYEMETLASAEVRDKVEGLLNRKER